MVESDRRHVGAAVNFGSAIGGFGRRLDCPGALPGEESMRVVIPLKRGTERETRDSQDEGADPLLHNASSLFGTMLYRSRRSRPRFFSPSGEPLHGPAKAGHYLLAQFELQG